MTYDRTSVGNEIRRRRQALGLTQEQAAEIIDRSLRFYARIELGQSGMSVETLLAICRMLKTTPDRILFEKPSEEALRNQAWVTEAIASCPVEKQEAAIAILKAYLEKA